MFPRFEASGYASLGNRDHRRSTSNTYSAASSLAQTRGSHTLKFGFDGRMFRSNTRELRSPSGEFRFNAAFTQGPNPLQASLTAGNGLASLLTGFGGGSINSVPAGAIRNMYYAFFFNDDIRFKRLTINAGVRWEYEQLRTERYNRYSWFDFGAVSPIQGKVPASACPARRDAPPPHPRDRPRSRCPPHSRWR